MGQSYKLPIIVTENGVEDPEDNFRTRYLSEHIHKLWHGVNFNWKITGYFHWSLVDNFEWERGWTQRFGLWELDPATQERVNAPVQIFCSDLPRKCYLIRDGWEVCPRGATKAFS